MVVRKDDDYHNCENPQFSKFPCAAVEDTPGHHLYKHCRSEKRKRNVENTEKYKYLQRT